MKDNHINLQSSVNEMGKTTTQILHFVGDVKRTIPGVISSKIKEGEFVKLFLKDGRMILISKKNILMTEIFNEN